MINEADFSALGLSEEMLACGDEIAAIDRKMQEMYRKIQGVE